MEVGPLSAEVLLWKYFDPCGREGMPRSFVAREGGAIIGHVGVCPSAFVGGPEPGGNGGEPVATFHMVDWLGSVGHPGLGSSLMHHVFPMAPTQYILGGTAAARRAFDANDYERLADVPVFRKVIRAGYRLRASDRPSARSVVAAARDALRIASRREQASETPLDPRRVAEFGDEVRGVADAYGRSATFTERSAERLNHLLRQPSGSMEGYLLLEGGRVRGLAMLNILREGRSRIGRIVECLLDEASTALFRSAIVALVSVSRDRGVDAVFGCGSTPWSAEAFRDAGFVEAFRLESRLRDRSGLLPRAGPFHQTYLEADYSYLP